MQVTYFFQVFVSFCSTESLGFIVVFFKLKGKKIKLCVLYRVDNDRCWCGIWKNILLGAFLSHWLHLWWVTATRYISHERRGLVVFWALTFFLTLMQPVLMPASWALLALGIIIWGCFLFHETPHKNALCQHCSVKHVAYSMFTHVMWHVKISLLSGGEEGWS